MKIIGLVLEINPFHNGHKYFIDSINKDDGDIIVAVCSTTICQRGQFSVYGKDVKTSLLLENGIDIVVELPGVLANQGGYNFALAAIEILSQFSINTLVFGSETNSLRELNKLSKEYEPASFNDGIHTKGLSNLKSNDILGISYLRALRTLNMRHVNVITIKRIMNHYNDKDLSIPIASATSIRENLLSDNLQHVMPIDSKNKMLVIDHDQLFTLFITNLMWCVDNDYKIFLSESNHILNKFINNYIKHSPESLKQLIEISKDKNNSTNKLNRVAINTMLLISQNVDTSLVHMHVLGFSKNGQSYLKNLNNKKIVMSKKNLVDDVSTIEVRISRLYQIVTKHKVMYDFSKVQIRR